jgi:hypothetical protein
MIWPLLSILLFQTACGLVEGVKNVQACQSGKRYVSENAYHWYRNLQGAAFILAIATGYFAPHSWQIALVIVCGWIAGNAWYSRLLIRIAWGKWNYNWNKALSGKIPWWTIFDPSPVLDWWTFVIFGVTGIIFALWK